MVEFSVWSTVDNMSTFLGICTLSKEISTQETQRSLLEENSSSDLVRNINFGYGSVRWLGLLGRAALSPEKWEMSESV